MANSTREPGLQQVHAVIMAGGSGTRLWPASRRRHPKHLLPLLDDSTLFQSTLKRLEGFIPPERTWVVTTSDQVAMLKEQAGGIPQENYLPEPAPRGTASVAGLAAAVLQRRDPQAVMLLLPSDHYIGRADIFRQLMESAVRVAEAGYLVTLGIQPTYASTGYGYIQHGERLEGSSGLAAHRVLRFTEKPEAARARAMLEAGDHSWNSGMFAWRVDRILEEIHLLMPPLAAALDRIGPAWGTGRQDEVLASCWMDLPTVTIDYGVMEKVRRVAVLPATGLEWSDVGSWESLFELLPPDGDGNVVIHADHLPLGAQRNLVVAPGKKLVVTVGVEDLVVVDTGDALLVCRRDQAQRVREVIEKLKATQHEQYL